MSEGWADRWSVKWGAEGSHTVASALGRELGMVAKDVNALLLEQPRPAKTSRRFYR